MLWLKKINAGFTNGGPDNNNTNNLLFKFASDGFLVCNICNSADFLKYFIFAKSRIRNKINVVLFNVLLESQIKQYEKIPGNK